MRDLGILEVLCTPRSPRQRAYVERMIGSIRRECLDHVLVFHETSLRRTLRSYLIRYPREADTLLFPRQAKQSRTSNRVMRFPPLPSFTFFPEIMFSVGTIPLYLGHLKGSGKNVWYVLTDVDDSNVAAELGLNFSAKLTFAAHSARTGNLDANGDIVFDAGTVNFKPERKIDAASCRPARLPCKFQTFRLRSTSRFSKQ